MLKRLVALVSLVLGMGLAASVASAEEAKTEKQARDPRAVGSLVWGIKGGLTISTLAGDGANPSASQRDPSLHQGVAIGGFNTPMRRSGTPDEVADLIAFLASDESRYITGQLVIIDGGNTLQEYKGPIESYY